MARYQNILEESYDRLVFLHIPKTGGTSVRHALTKLFSEDEVISHNRKNSEHNFSLSCEENNKFKCLLGHYHYSKMQELDGKNLFIAIIREPVARALSFYNHVQSSTENRLHEECKGKSLMQCIEDSPRFCNQISNRQTRALVSDKREITFDQALKTIFHNNFVLTTIESFVDVCQTVVPLVDSSKDYSISELPHLNNSTVRLDCTDEDKQAILDLNQEDLKLYCALRNQML